MALLWLATRLLINGSTPVTEWRCHIVEQIIAYGRRIVQIMIQATDLAQILYRGHPSRKKRGPRKISIWPPFSKMAAMGYPENVFFALNGQQMVGKDNNRNRFYVLSIANVQILSIWLPISKMAVIAYHVMSLCRKMATDSPKNSVFLNKRYICACRK